MDINRVAAAVQLVESRNGFFYGKDSTWVRRGLVADDALAASDSRKNGIAAGY